MSEHQHGTDFNGGFLKSKMYLKSVKHIVKSGLMVVIESSVSLKKSYRIIYTSL